ncbi:MAG: uracil-DNA glycosylase [Acidimicrobiales bacterium]
MSWRESVALSPPASHRGENYWARPVPSFGDPRARLVVVGLAPAANGGNRTGRMFTGDRSGDFLFAGLYRAKFANQPSSTAIDDGLILRDCFVTAALRCCPPENRPTTEERDNCSSYLERVLDLLRNKRVVLCLGAFAYDATWRALSNASSPKKPKFAHGGMVLISDHGVSLVCSYHPSQRNVFTGLLTPKMFDDVLRLADTRLG